MPHNWNLDQVPDLSGRVIIVTGANSGIGYEAALALAKRKADILANLLFTHELDRRFKDAGNDTISVACHPGWAAITRSVESRGLRTATSLVRSRSEGGCAISMGKLRLLREPGTA